VPVECPDAAAPPSQGDRPPFGKLMAGEGGGHRGRFRRKLP
jgi:hypothetical protein